MDTTKLGTGAESPVPTSSVNRQSSLSVQWVESLDKRIPEWIVPGFLARQAITVLAGEPGSGKTTFAAELAYDVATGEPHWDDEVRRGRVMWLGYDDPVERIRAEKLELLGDVPTEQICTLRDLLPLSEASLRDYVFAMRDNSVSLVVVDTLLDWFPLPDYDKAGGVAKSMQCLRRFVERTGVAVLGIHHTSKDENRKGVARIANSTLITAKADVCIILSGNAKDAERGSLEVVKNRLAPPGWRVGVRKADGRFKPEEDNRPLTTAEEVYKIIKQHGSIMRENLLKALDGRVSDRAIDRAINRLGNDGSIVIGHSADCNRATYALPSVSKASKPARMGGERGGETPA